MSQCERDRPEVVVTGMGVLAPGGNNLPLFWDTLCSGKSTADHLTVRCPGSRELPVRFGCAVQDVDPIAALGNKAARRMDRFSQLAVIAGMAAISDSGITDPDKGRSGIIVGTGIGGAGTHQGAVLGELHYEEMRRIPYAIPMIMSNAAAGQLAIHTGWTGPNITISTACASGANAIGEGMRMIRAGIADVVLAGGSDTPMTPFIILAFHNLRALSTRNDDPGAASRPFDAQRDGFVLGEAAAFVVLESAQHARARGAAVWAQARGYGCTSDAWDMVTPKEDGSEAERCMSLALRDAHVTTSEIEFINAHGTSTVLNDRTEAVAIRRLFGADAPPVTSNKGTVGHSMGASGAVEFIATCLSLSAGRIPPTANYERSEQQIDLDIVSGNGAPCQSGNALAISNSFAFGGSNACLVIQGGDRRLSS
ncbi:MAG TPA: beta-ketoacyl-[acyl-carrier-protein] synthase family protein [Streptosporangiaceae bacterium]